jgi:hypothetical protein
MTLLRLRTLPRNESTLQKFSSLLESIFVHHADKSSSAIDAFKEFWSYGYCDVLPAERWPLKIQQYFNASLEESPDPHMDVDAEPLQSTTPESPLYSIQPITPTSRHLVLSSPTRPQQQNQVSFSLAFPEIPSVSVITKNQSPRSSPGIKPRKSKADKENQPPDDLTPRPLAETKAPPSSPLKRRVSDSFPPDGTKKKRRTESNHSRIASSDSEREVLQLLQLEPDLLKARSTTRKRKYIIDAVVLPTLQELRKASRSKVPEQNTKPPKRPRRSDSEEEGKWPFSPADFRKSLSSPRKLFVPKTGELHVTRIAQFD